MAEYKSSNKMDITAPIMTGFMNCETNLTIGERTTLQVQLDETFLNGKFQIHTPKGRYSVTINRGQQKTKFQPWKPFRRPDWDTQIEAQRLLKTCKSDKVIKDLAEMYQTFQGPYVQIELDTESETSGSKSLITPPLTSRKITKRNRMRRRRKRNNKKSVNHSEKEKGEEFSKETEEPGIEAKDPILISDSEDELPDLKETGESFCNSNLIDLTSNPEDKHIKIPDDSPYTPTQSVGTVSMKSDNKENTDTDSDSLILVGARVPTPGPNKEKDMTLWQFLYEDEEQLKEANPETSDTELDMEEEPQLEPYDENDNTSFYTDYAGEYLAREETASLNVLRHTNQQSSLSEKNLTTHQEKQNRLRGTNCHRCKNPYHSGTACFTEQYIRDSQRYLTETSNKRKFPDDLEENFDDNPQPVKRKLHFNDL